MRERNDPLSGPFMQDSSHVRAARPSCGLLGQPRRWPCWAWRPRAWAGTSAGGGRRNLPRTSRHRPRQRAGLRPRPFRIRRPGEKPRAGPCGPAPWRQEKIRRWGLKFVLTDPRDGLYWMVRLPVPPTHQERDEPEAIRESPNQKKEKAVRACSWCWWSWPP